MNERICINCKFWVGEIGAIDQRHQQMVGPKAIYGKCEAYFTAEDGSVVRFDMGMFSQSPCNATNNLGELLFIAQPEG